ncbi:hypothetical protein [Cecembia lonarensis]|uniref:Uncharacterized protein n=1 Tax=Cecembia lonarensis (strain CCUG 58316 / KCTC 22772 / LW9) TaxID=1225176 RepID=K1L3C2_CECL9|nr:hypothetical protein [Cecembia lonarensis]EKB50925.1 hypothetical protein B879_00453 [Cecembia lonarensis LW9]
MDIKEFTESIVKKEMPQGLSLPLQALWHDADGNWQKAHELVDGPEGKVFARVHAYLHRKEGDLWNADYWYRRSAEERPQTSLKEEWEFLVRRLL